MKNKFLLLTWLLAVPLLWSSCSLLNGSDDDNPTPTPEEQLPPITTTGENTFGCLVNGEVWLPRGPDKYNMAYDERTGYFIFIGRKTLADDENQAIALNGEAKETYLPANHFIGTYSKIINTLIRYNMDTVLHSELMFYRLDPQENIASGIFSFTAIRESEPFDTVHITEGRFDFKYAN